MITSLFDITTYQVSISAGEHGLLIDYYYEPIGNIDTTLTDCEDNGEKINNICALPDDDYYFTGWSDGNTEQCRNFTITQDTTIVANFEKIPSIANTQDNPYTIEEAIALINTGLSYKDSVYVIGIVKNINVSGIESYGNAAIYLEAGNQTFEFYRMLNMGGKPFTSSDELRALFTAGDTIIAKGVLSYYAAQGIYELAAGCYLTEVRKQKTHAVTLKGIDIYCSRNFTDDWGNSDYETFHGATINMTVKDGNAISFQEYADCGTWLGWSDGVTDMERIITIISDTVITSLFDAPIYHVSIAAGEHGYLTNYYGDSIGNLETTLTDCDGESERIDYICAIPDDGYYFAGWSDGVGNQCRYFYINKDTTIVALFKEIKHYSVTLQGSYIRGSYYQYVDDRIRQFWFYDSEVNIMALEDWPVYFYEDNMDCGEWLGWSDGVTDIERAITITSDTVITSRFDVPTYQVNISAGEGGQLTNNDAEPIGNIEVSVIDCNSNGEWTGSICATPNDGYYFIGWSDGVSDPCRDILLNSDTTIVASFAQKFPVTVVVGVHSNSTGMGAADGSGNYMTGDVITITATPNSGYHFVEWSDGNGYATRDIYLSSDTTLYARFAAGDFGGKCGANLYWSWYEGELIITGTGAMDLYHYPTWKLYSDMQITSLSLPEGITTISAEAFYEQPLTTVILPASVEWVGRQAFANNDKLLHFEYQGNNIKVGDYNRPLSGCRNLQYFRGNIDLGGYYYADTLIISNGLAGEGLESIQYIDLTNADNTSTEGFFYTIVDGVEGIPATRTLYLPTVLTEIMDLAFVDLRYLKEITIPAGVTYIGAGAFEDCRSMTSVTFAGNNVKSIGDWAFYNCHSLRNLTLPEGVEEVGLAAFFDCTYLNELTIPSTMNKIADNGFAGCRKLSTMYVNALVPPTIEAKTFEDVDRATPVFVPRGTMERYQADQYWSEFFNMAEYDAPTGNLNVSADEENGLRKVVRNGQVLIIRGDEVYTVLGEKIQ